QMAVYLLRLLMGDSYTPPACSGIFTDVACPSPFADWIEDLFNRGVTAGCTGTAYCPGTAVNRSQMAVFLSATFSLKLYGPRGEGTAREEGPKAAPLRPRERGGGAAPAPRCD